MIISIEDMTFKYKKNMIFSNADLFIERQGIYGLVAPNGYGKTTLLNILGGVEKNYSGNIRIEGTSIKNMKATSFSYLQSNEVLFPYLSGYDHLKFLCDIHKISYDNINSVASKFEMTDYLKKSVSSYSLGMKQRLLLGMAIIKKPQLILLDEPLTGLDPTSTYIVRNVLKELDDTGVTLILSSHDLNELDKLTSSIFFIKDHSLYLEDLNSYKIKYIYLSVDSTELERTCLWLKNNCYSFYLNNHSTMVIEIKNFSPSNLLKELINNNIKIRSYEIKHITSESIYQKYYLKEK